MRSDRLTGLLARGTRRARRLSLAAGRGLPTALVVEVPEAEQAVGALRARLDPSASAGIPAHITVLTPFLGVRQVRTAELAALTELFASVEEFPFELTAVGHFPGVTYLEPSSAPRFVELTQRVWARWPDHPPFEGAYDEVVPHLTVADGPHDVDEVQAAAAARLPVTATARGVTLLRQSVTGRWRAAHYFPFSARVPA